MATPAVDPAHRRDLYAYGVVKLERDPVDRFAEGTFDTAVTNGLAAIVDSFQPAPVPASRVPSAGVMLETLRTAYGAPGDPTVAVPVAAAGTTDTVTIAVQQLLDALARTQAPRHGRGGSGTVTSADIEALRDLDDHTALNCLHSTLLAEHWSRFNSTTAMNWAGPPSTSLFSPSDSETTGWQSGWSRRAGHLFAGIQKTTKRRTARCAATTAP